MYICIYICIFAYTYTRTHIETGFLTHTFFLSCNHIHKPTHRYYCAHEIIGMMCMSHLKHVHESCHLYAYVTSQIWRSHLTGMNQSRHTYAWVMPHSWIRHVFFESRHTHEEAFLFCPLHICIIRVIAHQAAIAAHIWMIHDAHVKESLHTQERVIAHIGMSHVTRRNEWPRMSHCTHRNESLRT